MRTLTIILVDEDPVYSFRSKKTFNERDLQLILSNAYSDILFNTVLDLDKQIDAAKYHAANGPNLETGSQEQSVGDPSAGDSAELKSAPAHEATGPIKNVRAVTERLSGKTTSPSSVAGSCRKCGERFKPEEVHTCL